MRHVRKASINNKVTTAVQATAMCTACTTRTVDVQLPQTTPTSLEILYDECNLVYYLHLLTAESCTDRQL